MRLSRDEIEHMGFSIVKNLIKDNKIKTKDKNSLVEYVQELIYQEFQTEEKLDQEVRQILNQHRDQIRSENIEYQTMFRMIKSKLAKEKNIVL
ncbi:MAG: DUF507 family protein [Candidatus Aminicenantes bacterium]|nr:DUF507 family protein [Candidatus Aminicenantes bacterium]